MTLPMLTAAAALRRPYVLVAAFLVLSGCSGSQPPSAAAPADARCQAIADVAETYGVLTAGAAVIEDGRVVWTCTAGEERPGVPASAATRFSAASITKVVAAEAVLRLAADERLSLDEPMAPYWVDPDVADDPRHESLTPRLALTHATGFPNWRFFVEGGRLAFVRDPGTGFGYSGEGFDYIARFLERKTGRGFYDLVQEVVFDPVGMASATMVPYASDTTHFVQAVDEDGRAYAPWCRPGGYCTPEGHVSAAHGLRVTVGDLAAFLVSVAENDGYGSALAADRDRVQTSVVEEDAAVDCSTAEPCPEAQGYGLGWRVLDLGNDRLLFHGGSDWSEVAVAAVSPVTGDGLVVLLNAPNVRAARAMPEVLELIAPDSPLVAHYERRRQRADG